MKEIALFKELIKQRCGLHFTGDSEHLLATALHKRIAATDEKTPAAYYQRLQNDDHEFQELVNLLTINETYFFREPEQLHFLVDHLIPRLLSRQQHSARLRILSAGCSTGEEPYSIAIALWEKYGESVSRLFSLAAGDIDKTVLDKARAALYKEFSFRALTTALRERYFERHDQWAWRVKDAVRQSVQFHHLNLLDATASDELRDFDVIFFRNVSIYFDEPTRCLIQKNLAARLKPDGCLILSSAEILGNDLGVLPLVEDGGQFYFVKNAPASANLRVAIEAHKSVELLNDFVQQTGRESAVQPAVLDFAHLTPPLMVAPPEPPPAPQAAPPVPPPAVDVDPDRALRLTREKRYEAAMQAVNQRLSQQPDDRQALLLLAFIQLNRKDFAAAEATAQRVLSHDAWSIDAFVILALVAKWQDRTELAEKHFKQAVYACHECWPAHYYLAEIYRAARQTEKARRAYRIVVQQLSAQAEARDGLSVIPLDLPEVNVRFLCEHHLSKLDGASV